MVVIVATREVKDGITTIAFASDSAQLDGFHHLTEKNKTAAKIVKTEVLTIGCSGSHRNFVLLQEFVQIAKPPIQPSIVAVMRFFVFFNNWKYERFDVSADDSRFLIPLIPVALPQALPDTPCGMVRSNLFLRSPLRRQTCRSRSRDTIRHSKGRTL